MGRVRVHQHVNPLAPYFRFTPEALSLEKSFETPQNPLFLDIGSARGRFLLQMAQNHRDMNFLGIEIREPLVDEANRLAREYGLPNLHYVFNNAMLSLDKVLENLPPGILQNVTIQFPDPWFKKRHAKRRMVTPHLARTVSRHLSKTGKLFIQTDIKVLFDEMISTFVSLETLIKKDIDENPFGVRTEREIAVEEKQLPVYRVLFNRHETPNLIVN
jgi:tRNA (guanine-N7-)-methyltransferase